MKLFIIHHHLNPGGVTRIIQSQIQSLKGKYPDIDITVLTGNAGDQSFFDEQNVELDLNPDLDYLLGKNISGNDILQLKTKLSKYLLEKIPYDAVIHVHNLNLGKNPVLTLALSEMAGKGYMLFNHCHDFAEDRPQNMNFMNRIIGKVFNKGPQKVMYPALPNYLFGTINAFDRERVINKGINRENVFHLPNPVYFETSQAISKSGARASVCNTLGIDPKLPLITYPVRVIRRKNIGELILFSTIFEGRANWLVTQPPQNPEELVPYKAWKALCDDEKISVHFEVGNRVNFEELLLASDVCITTSTREGFGMVFLEPWLLGVPVVGRNIDYVTTDLIASGVEFPLLWDEVNVELDGAVKDFGKMDADQQQEFIRKIANDRSEKKKIRDMNPRLQQIFEPFPDGLIQKNKRVIKNQYSLEQYATQLHDIYQKLAG